MLEIQLEAERERNLWLSPSPEHQQSSSDTSSLVRQLAMLRRECAQYRSQNSELLRRVAVLEGVRVYPLGDGYSGGHALFHTYPEHAIMDTAFICLSLTLWSPPLDVPKSFCGDVRTF